MVPSKIGVLLLISFFISSCVQRTDSSLEFSPENFPSLDFSIDDGDGYYFNKKDLVIKFTTSRSDIDAVSLGEGEACLEGSWVPVAEDYRFTLSDEDGEKAIAMKVKTQYGFESSCMLKKIFLDRTKPKINLFRAPNVGTYSQNQHIEIKLALSEPVKVIGVPRIQITIGSSSKFADYISGDGTNTLLFRYKVVLEDSDRDGVVVASMVDLNGGAIIDFAGNSAEINFESPDLSGVIVEGNLSSSCSTSGPVKLVIVSPSETTIGLATSVSIEARDSLDKLCNYASLSVDLALSSTTASGGGRVTISNGKGAVSINNTKAENVTLSLLNSTNSKLDISSTATLIFKPLGITCPTNYLPVLGSATYSTPAFCVAKYEMKVSSGKYVSSPLGTPANLNQTQSLTACRNLGAKYDLMTNAQWQTIAQNIEQVQWNWSGGIIGSLGGLSRGHSDYSPARALEASTSDSNACVNTGQSCSLTVWDSQRRVHRLSNGEQIWDFAGNVWEWVKEANSSNWGSSQFLANVSGTSHPIINSLGGLSGNVKFHFGPSGNYFGVGIPYAGLGYALLTDTNAIARGGGWWLGSPEKSHEVGIFAVRMNQTASYASTVQGFRCVYNP